MLKLISLFVLIVSCNLTAQSPLLTLMGDEAQSVYAIDLNGTNEYAEISSPNDLALSGDFTIMFWAKPTDLDNTQELLARDIDISRGWEIYFSNDDKFGVVFDAGTGGGFTSINTLNIGEWVFIAVTQTLSGADTISIYIDATLDNKRGSNAFIPTTAPFSIGRRAYPGFEGYYNGLIGEVQIISGYALTLPQINQVYSNGFSSSYGSGSVVAWYKWQGSTDADMLKDYSASDNDLTGTNLTTADQVKIGTTYK